MRKTIAIIVPVYNETGNLALLANEIDNVLKETPYDYRIYYVDDGSADDSLNVLRSLAAQNKHVKYISFSRNFGKDSALMAGLKIAAGDAFVTMDADLQHPPKLLPELLELWEEGYKVVYAYRDSRNMHTSFRNHITSKLFYKIANSLSDVEMEEGISDYRLMDKQVVEELRKMKEIRPFLRGLVKWMGFKRVGIPYIPSARASGQGKYNTMALLRLALQGITSFSIKPLLISIYVGFLSAGIAVLYIPYVIFSYFFEHPISGWSSVIMSIAFFGGLLLISLGITGIYLGKVFMQTKERPDYIVEESNISLDE